MPHELNPSDINPFDEGKHYVAADITVSFDAKRCRHFAECVRGLPDVFDTDHRPWIDPSKASADSVAEVVRRCPSGALQYRLTSGPPEAADSATTATPLEGGPLLLRGDLTIVEVRDGVEVDRHETRMAACRCGKTANDIFCDGSCSAA